MRLAPVSAFGAGLMSTFGEAVCSLCRHAKSGGQHGSRPLRNIQPRTRTFTKLKHPRVGSASLQDHYLDANCERESGLDSTNNSSCKANRRPEKLVATVKAMGPV